MRGSVLLVEDDPSVRETATLLLERAGHRITTAADGATALELVDRRRFDMILLDVMLPGVDGFEVCRRIRARSGVPIIMLTARTTSHDIVQGLSLGADDYVTKPYDPGVLVARVGAVLRRASSEEFRNRAPGELTVGTLHIDAVGVRARLGDEPLDLTAIEFRLLLELARDAGVVKRREDLLELVWGYDYLGDSRLVDMAIMRLRDKLHDDPRSPTFIATVRGVGYRFERQTA